MAKRGVLGVLRELALGQRASVVRVAASRFPQLDPFREAGVRTITLAAHRRARCHLCCDATNADVCGSKGSYGARS